MPFAGTWTEVATWPIDRHSQSAVTAEDGAAMIVFGGYYGSGSLNDVWRLALATGDVLPIVTWLCQIHWHLSHLLVCLVRAVPISLAPLPVTSSVMPLAHECYIFTLPSPFPSVCVCGSACVVCRPLPPTWLPTALTILCMWRCDWLLHVMCRHLDRGDHHRRTTHCPYWPLSGGCGGRCCHDCVRGPW